MKRTLFFLILFSVFFSRQSEAIEKTEELFRICQKNKAACYVFFSGYYTAATLIAYEIKGMNKQFNDNKHVSEAQLGMMTGSRILQSGIISCPKGRKQNVGQTMNMWQNFVGNRPELMQKPIYVSVRLAMDNEFPCSKIK